jgi:hypothetical protein
MIEIPITLQRIEKIGENEAVVAEIETAVESVGGKVINKEKSLSELLFGAVNEKTPTLKQVLEND